ncbi:MAG: hypothetical protein ACPGWM_03860 [Flavobacteriales bacterium]
MIQFSKNFLKTALLSALFLAMLNLHVTAQSTSPSDIYVKIEGISPVDYGLIVKKLRLHPDFDTKQACVPAELLIFENKGDQDSEAAFTSIVALIKEVTELSDFTLLEQYTYDDFMSGCRAERGRAH